METVPLSNYLIGYGLLRQLKYSGVTHLSMNSDELETP